MKRKRDDKKEDPDKPKTKRRRKKGEFKKGNVPKKPNNLISPPPEELEKEDFDEENIENNSIFTNKPHFGTNETTKINNTEHPQSNNFPEDQPPNEKIFERKARVLLTSDRRTITSDHKFFDLSDILPDSFGGKKDGFSVKSEGDIYFDKAIKIRFKFSMGLLVEARFLVSEKLKVVKEFAQKLMEKENAELVLREPRRKKFSERDMPKTLSKLKIFANSVLDVLPKEKKDIFQFKDVLLKEYFEARKKLKLPYSRYSYPKKSENMEVIGKEHTLYNMNYREPTCVEKRLKYWKTWIRIKYLQNKRLISQILVCIVFAVFCLSLYPYFYGNNKSSRSGSTSYDYYDYDEYGYSEDYY